MNETHLARIEPQNSPSSSDKKQRWYYQVEASCWLLLHICRPDTDLMFCFEYKDSLKKHSVVIDRARVSYLRDSLMSGRFQLEGFGEFTDARLLLISDEGQPDVKVQNVNFRILQSSATLKPHYKLVA